MIPCVVPGPLQWFLYFVNEIVNVIFILTELAVYVYNDLSIIRSGGIEVRGLKASAIARRKPLGEPVLEKHVFIPYKEPEDLDLNSSLRACVHIVLENQQEVHVKTVEMYKENVTMLSPEVALILGDLPLIQVSKISFYNHYHIWHNSPSWALASLSTPDIPISHQHPPILNF